MPPRFTRALTVMLMAIMLSFAIGAQANAIRETPSALAMTGDVLFARPALLAMTAIGGAVYLVSLPFSLLGGNAVEAGDILVVEPARAAFVRCLGCTMGGGDANDVAEQEAH